MQPILCDRRRRRNRTASVVVSRRTIFPENCAAVEVWELVRVETVPDPRYIAHRIQYDYLVAQDITGVGRKLGSRTLGCAGDYFILMRNYGRVAVRQPNRLVIEIRQRLLSGDLQVSRDHRPLGNHYRILVGIQSRFQDKVVCP